MPARASVDVDALWDDDPAVAEAHFRAALANASGDDALILETQIARTYGLRRDFAQARRILDDVEPRLARAGAEARARYALELGRTLASATHPPETQTDATRAAARSAYESAASIARDAGLDALRVDALHMMGFVDTQPADQLRWARAALAVAQASSQPAARRWEASLRNNAGYALHELGRYEEALVEFRMALALREQGTNAQATRIAWWMVAWTLRALGRDDEALDIQLRLERESVAAGTPDPDVFEELEILYRQRGDTARAAAYAERRRALSGPR
ncbi:MAG TPA: tetratricopeptide repeat protein [Caldimonas sp.]|nr:tetratricopeptide repeat protein [Caldimonas sp.]